MEHIEHPAIGRLMATGYDKEPEPLPICPKCGTETDTFYKNIEHEIIGCDACVRPVDAWECKDEVA